MLVDGPEFGPEFGLEFGKQTVGFGGENSIYFVIKMRRGRGSPEKLGDKSFDMIGL